MNDYQSVLQMIRDGAEPAEVEAILSAEETPLTDDQIASLREEVLNAATLSPAEEAAYAADRAYDQAKDDALTEDL